jgi:twitching motility protein PilU
MTTETPAMLDFRKLLQVMTDHDASDLYITVDSPPSYRVNGVIRPAGNRCLEPEETEELARSIMNEKQQKEFESNSEMNLALYYKSLGRYRVNIFRQRTFVALVIRRIVSNIKTIEDLKLPEILKDVAMTKRGLVLVVGATGSGKSTSLASIIDWRNSNQAGHIITIEDPIEFIHVHKKSLIAQREVGMDTSNYHTALKNALRQAPDVILIGEIRDTETMEAAIAFAETGHLCLATLHSNNANQAMERIMNFFPVQRHKQIYMQLSLNLKSIVSQRLIKSLDGGRVPAVEVLLGSPRVKDLILKGEIHELKEAMEKGQTIGMQTFDEALYRLYSEEKISLDEALKNADSANNLRLRVKLADDSKLDIDPQGTGAFRMPKALTPAKESMKDSEEKETHTKKEELKLSLD